MKEENLSYSGIVDKILICTMRTQHTHSNTAINSTKTEAKLGIQDVGVCI